MKDLIIFQQKAIWLSCYKAYKHKGESRGECPWNYTEVNSLCQNCRWLTINKTTMNGFPAMKEDLIAKVENGFDYKELSVNPIILESLPDGIKNLNNLLPVPGGEEK